MVSRRDGLLLAITLLAVGAFKLAQSTACKCNHMSSCLIADVDNRALSQLSQNCPAGLGHLNDLLIVRYNDTKLTADAFASCGNLTMLEIFAGWLSAIEPGAFGKIPDLVKIVIQHNHLRNLEDNTFQGLGNLRLLYLLSCEITTISENAFAGLKSLSQLVLTNNKLTHLPAALLRPTPRLRSIVLNHNLIGEVPAGFFDDFDDIFRLDLSNNRLTSFEFPLLNASLLVLHNNSLTKLYLNGHPSIIGADHNRIAEISGTGENVTILILNDNAITDITPLAGMKKLQKLILNNNPLQPNTVFSTHTSLEHLDLSNTSLVITEKTFANLSYLQLLDLSYNGLAEIDFRMFASLTELQILNVAFNRIEKINFIELREYLPNLHVLEICGNGWNSTYMQTTLEHMNHYKLSADMQGLSQFFLFTTMFVELCTAQTETTTKPNLDYEAYQSKEFADIVDLDLAELYPPSSPATTTTETQALLSTVRTNRVPQEETTSADPPPAKKAVSLVNTKPTPAKQQPIVEASPLYLTFQVFVYLFAVVGVTSLVVLAYYIRQRRFNIRRISPMDIPDSVRLV
ncbi:insulin-like growth factor-binding protein complex acid labile subunit [Anopheles bellator]|uniref:insulin-like growth factor-binding protein complex acid labile subunit n=1 Tax=Anopheles bellator TaxID=139047 RepID=UPI00264A4A42|nr:insulin-like growth factor-binding protein complex acid labile subunit [Anopheles bellator]